MMFFSRLKTTLILAVCVVGALLCVPNFAPAPADWVPWRSVRLGLDLRGGSYLLLDKGDYAELFKATTVTHGSRAEFAISGKSTFVKLAGQNLSLFANRVRETAVFCRSEALAFARAPIASPLVGASLAGQIGDAPPEASALAELEAVFELEDDA